MAETTTSTSRNKKARCSEPLDLTCNEDHAESLLATAKKASARQAAAARVVVGSRMQESKLTDAQIAAFHSKAAVVPKDKDYWGEGKLTALSQIEQHGFELNKLIGGFWATATRIFNGFFDPFKGEVTISAGIYKGSVYQGHVDQPTAPSPRVYTGLLIRGYGVHFGQVAFEEHSVVDALRAYTGNAVLSFRADVNGATLTKYETAAVKLFTLKDLLYIDRDGEALLICTKHGLVPAAIIFYYEILMGMGTPEFEAAGIKGAELRKTFVHARMKVQEDRPIWRGLGYLAAMATMHEDDLAEEVIKFETWMDNQYHEERVYDHVEALGCGCCH